MDVPPALARLLEEDPAALEAFERMPPSHQREHAGYVKEAKQEETRARRAEKALGMIAEWGRQRPPREA